MGRLLAASSRAFSATVANTMSLLGTLRHTRGSMLTSAVGGRSRRGV